MLTLNSHRNQNSIFSKGTALHRAGLYYITFQQKSGFLLNILKKVSELLLRISLGLLIFLFSSSQLAAQDDPSFKTIDQSDGLSNGTVTCIAQDKDGFMWFGTKNGLNKYDGSEFIEFNSQNSLLASNDISALVYHSSRNELWIGTNGGGLYAYDLSHQVWRKISLEAHGDWNNIRHIYLDSQSHLWVGTDEGLYHLASQAKDTDTPQLIIEGESHQVIEISNQMLLVANSVHGLLRLRSSDFKYEQILKPANPINRIVKLNKDKYLIGTQGAGLLDFNLKTHAHKKINLANNSSLKEPKIINDLLRDKSKNVWIATDGQGLFRIDGNTGSINQYKKNNRRINSIPNNALLTIYQDQKDNIWIGTIWKGLSFLQTANQNASLHYSDWLGYNAYPVLSVYHKDRTLWVGTDGDGLYLHKNGESTRHFNTKSSPALGGNYIQSIYKDRSGLHWIGTFANGLCKFDLSKDASVIYSHDPKDLTTISHNNVRQVLQTSDSGLWVATWGGGLNFFNPRDGKFDHLLDANKNTLDITTLIHDRERDGLWISTFGEGIFFYDLNLREFKRLHMKLPRDSFLELGKVQSMYLDKNGDLYLGSWNRGLLKVDIDKSNHLLGKVISILSNLRVTSVEEDSVHNLWMSSNRGIIKYVPEKDESYPFGGINLLTNKEFHINSSCTDKNGNLYFGGIEGVLSFNPLTLALSKNDTALQFTSLLIFNKKNGLGEVLKTTIDHTSILNLDYDQNYLTLNFIAIQYPKADIVYSVKMEGLEESWREIGNTRFATYTNLPAGDYVFKVRTKTEGLIWNEPKSLKIHISRPPWKEWYAFIIYFVIFVCMLFLFHRYATQWEKLKSKLSFEKLVRENQQELSNAKQRFFTNISHEIRTPITLILGATSRLIRQLPPDVRGQKAWSSLQRNSNHLLHLVDEMLDASKLEAGRLQLQISKIDFVPFAKEIFLAFSDRAEKQEISYNFVVEDSATMLWIDTTQMKKVFYNLLANAFKFIRKGGNIRMVITCEKDFILCTIEDDGSGIPKKELERIFNRFFQSDINSEAANSGFGLGLSICQEIVELHAGEIYAENNSLGGATFFVKIPRGNANFSALELGQTKPTDEIITPIINQEDDFIAEKFKALGPVTLLIVEDNDELRSYLEHLFEDKITVLCAENGAIGLDLAIKNSPDIIVSDIMMPEMDGVEMTHQLKTDIRTRQIPIILLTAYDSVTHKKEGFGIGADDYVSKPFNEGLLGARIINLLKNRRQIRQGIKEQLISVPKTELSIETKNEEFLSRFMNLIEDNIGKNELKIAFLTMEMGMSYSAFYAKLKSVTGMTVSEFTKDFKLKHAAVLMTRYGYGITEAAYHIGYSDRRYFTRLFKQKFGQSPSAYIETYRIRQE